MFILVLIISVGSWNGGISIEKIESYRTQEQCQMAGKIFVDGKGSGGFTREVRGFSCIPSPTQQSIKE